LMERDDMRDFVNALRNHELGHKEIAERELRGHDSRLSAVGVSPAEVKKMLNAALAAQLRALYDEMQRAEVEYDRVTQHGLRQGDGSLYGFRGGNNVEFVCR
ncbi:MAG: DUF922 domain-containing Zn-dependent protease, partial [Candidatus Eremiobacteraeota bacterium]|nr:DUF922 domain-containing Zn-dependent protease [Candidatus Eremiobacteraeota bacterium]